MRDEDREPLSLVRGLLWPLGDLCADAMRAALTPPAPKGLLSIATFLQGGCAMVAPCLTSI